METILKENTRYTIIIFDKYILCDIKDYHRSDIMFAPIDNLKTHKIKSYISEKVLMREVGHHITQWYIHVDRMCSWYKGNDWWQEIKKLNQLLIDGGFKDDLDGMPYSLRQDALEYCIKNGYVKIVKIQEKVALEF